MCMAKLFKRYFRTATVVVLHLCHKVAAALCAKRKISYLGNAEANGVYH